MKINDFVQYIREYDSDKFHAQEEEITEDELELIVEKIFDYLMMNEVDGVWLKQLLNEVRNE